MRLQFLELIAVRAINRDHYCIDIGCRIFVGNTKTCKLAKQVGSLPRGFIHAISIECYPEQIQASADANGVFEADSGRDFSAYGPSLDEFLKTATTVEGVPFASLYHVRRWKVVSDRPKDRADVELIDKYISEHATDTDSNTVLAAWTAYTDTIANWQKLVTGVTPIATDCGPVYELPNPIDRPNESFAIADMRALSYSEPHYHSNGETEIYIVLTGTGRVFVGDTETAVQPGSVIFIPPYMTHFVFPTNDLVIAAVNTPPFDVANTVPIRETNLSVGFDQDKFALLTRSLH